MGPSEQSELRLLLNNVLLQFKEVANLGYLRSEDPNSSIENQAYVWFKRFICLLLGTDEFAKDYE